MNMLTIAYYTSIKYLRNVLAMSAFILAPILIIFILTGSTDTRFIDNNSKEIIEVNSIDKSTAAQSSNLEVTIVEPYKNSLSINDKISIASMLIFLFYSSLLSSHSIISDLKNNTHLRLKSSPASFFENILGKSIGIIFITAICSLIIVLITKYAFHVNWSGNIGTTALSLLMFLIIVNSFGVIITGLTKNIYICALIAFSVNFAMVFPVMVGIYSPVENHVLEIVRKISFHSYTMNSIAGSITNDTALFYGSIFTLAIITIVMFCLSLLVGRRVLK